MHMPHNRGGADLTFIEATVKLLKDGLVLFAEGNPVQELSVLLETLHLLLGLQTIDVNK